MRHHCINHISCQYTHLVYSFSSKQQIVFNCRFCRFVVCTLYLARVYIQRISIVYTLYLGLVFIHRIYLTFSSCIYSLYIPYIELLYIYLTFSSYIYIYIHCMYLTFSFWWNWANQVMKRNWCWCRNPGKVYTEHFGNRYFWRRVGWRHTCIELGIISFLLKWLWVQNEWTLTMHSNSSVKYLQLLAVLSSLTINELQCKNKANR